MLPSWKGRTFADSSSLQSRDFERPHWCYLLWGVPAVLAFATSSAYNQTALSITGAGALWTIAVAWIGIGCFINGRSCGRVHCMIDGILLPVLSVVGALDVLSVISIGWTVFWISFFVILVGSFIVEWAFGKYSVKAGF
ncbi:MAG TPA: hypothetical protein VNE86_01175 [Nitrososphaerales archaeon]|nr:hypothetical protein [Nitrososphaerales archaeon]